MITADHASFDLVVSLVSGMLLALQAIHHLNCMTRATWRPIVITWILIGASAAAFVAGILAHAVIPDIYTATLLLSVCLHMLIDRRRRPRR